MTANGAPVPREGSSSAASNHVRTARSSLRSAKLIYFQTEGSRTDASMPSKCRSASGSRRMVSVVNVACGIGTRKLSHSGRRSFRRDASAVYLFGDSTRCQLFNCMKTSRNRTGNRPQASYDEIRRKRSDTLVRTLRREYGDHFANGFRGDATLQAVLRRENAQSLSEYLKSTRPITIQGRFATAHDAARTLGVSKSRADVLINAAKKSSPIVFAAKNKSNDTYVEFKSNKQKTATGPVVFAAKKKIGSTHVAFKTKKTKAKR
jgi:hypothetical protein